MALRSPRSPACWTCLVGRPYASHLRRASAPPGAQLSLFEEHDGYRSSNSGLVEQVCDVAARELEAECRFINDVAT